MYVTGQPEQSRHEASSARLSGINFITCCIASEEMLAQVGRIPLLVVGGGIGGLAAALAAAQAGYSAHVLGKAEEFTESGAGPQLAPNASRMMGLLVTCDEIQKHATF